MNSLRVFTQQNKNCYTLSSNSMDRYFIRAMFNYGNYDGLSNAPSFDLEIDGNKMMTIETSIDDIVYSEVIYTSRGDNISVCLARIQDKEYPFISSLEAWPLDDNMYVGMNRDLAWIMSYRYNYGTEDWIYGYPGDDYNRMWEPAPSQDLVPVLADTKSMYYPADEDPPDSAIFDAVEAQTSMDSITLVFANTKPNSVNYVLTYFTEMTELINKTRSFDIYVDDGFVINITPGYQNCTVARTYAHPEGNLTVELRPTATTEPAKPPIISAIEVYTASDALVTIGTSQDDLDGLGMIISAFFEKLKGWSGEPCLPIDTTWQWLGCAGNDPPRVTSLNLSGYGLDGSLPNFSQMQGLESIDLSSNNLNGSIPDFLGKLPNLKLLVDQNIPSGAPPRDGGKKSGHIIGIVVGIVVVIFVIAGGVYYLYRKKLLPGELAGLLGGQQATKPESEPPQNPQGEASVSINASTDPMLSRPQQNGNNRPRPDGGNFTMGNGNSEQNLGGGNVPVHGGAGEVSGHPSMVPDLDMDEFDELVQQHGSQRASGRA
ncbi:hypothetical protein LguiA_021058 [Lonicera macranthoides]